VNVTSFGPALDAIRYHDRLASDWDRRYQKASFRARLVALAECLDGKDLSGTKWLDAGCGTGTLSRWLADRGCAVLGVDAAQNMINSAAMLASCGSGSGLLRFQRVETIACLPLDSHSADGILCSSVLEYVPDPEACLTEFARVLRPGGMLVVSVPSAHSIIRRAQIACKLVGQLVGKNWVAYLNYSKHQYSRLEFERILIRQTFCLERAVPLGGPLPRWMQRTQTWGPLLMFSARKL
jgi:2-polyprenyl-6-hydroxyphenyl methylase/3-demethylubiquinone-9 3-methyltransferase